MLWTCTSEDCVKNAASWRAFSCYLPRNKQTHIPSAPLSNGYADPASSAVQSHNSSHPTHSDQGVPEESLCTAQESTDSWGATGGSWGTPHHDSSNMTNQPTDAFDFSDLEQALNRSQDQASKPPSKLQPLHNPMQSQRQQQPVFSCGLNSDCIGAQLPGFYLHMVAEAAGPSASLSTEEQHIAELVAAYQHEFQQVLSLLCSCCCRPLIQKSSVYFAVSSACLL